MRIPAEKVDPKAIRLVRELKHDRGVLTCRLAVDGATASCRCSRRIRPSLEPRRFAAGSMRRSWRKRRRRRNPKRRRPRLRQPAGAENDARRTRQLDSGPGAFGRRIATRRRAITSAALRLVDAIPTPTKPRAADRSPPRLGPLGRRQSRRKAHCVGRQRRLRSRLVARRRSRTAETRRSWLPCLSNGVSSRRQELDLGRSERESCDISNCPRASCCGRSTPGRCGPIARSTRSTSAACAAWHSMPTVRNSPAPGRSARRESPIAAMHACCLFDWKSGKVLQTFRPEKEVIATAWGVRFHPDGYLVAAGGSRTGGYLWFWRPKGPKPNSTCIHCRRAARASISTYRPTAARSPSHISTEPCDYSPDAVASWRLADRRRSLVRRFRLIDPLD